MKNLAVEMFKRAPVKLKSELIQFKKQMERTNLSRR